MKFLLDISSVLTLIRLRNQKNLFLCGLGDLTNKSDVVLLVRETWKLSRSLKTS